MGFPAGRFFALAAALGCASASGVVSGVSVSRGAVSPPAAVARAYFADYNRRDGSAMCAAFTGELRAWFEHLPGLPAHLGCAKIVAGRIGYGEESDTATFRRLEVRSTHAYIAGDTARVEVRARYHYKAYPKPLTISAVDEIYLQERGGRWQIAKPGGVYFASQSAYNPPSSALDPPIGDVEAHQPAPQSPSGFSCEAKAVRVIADASGDAPAEADIREASAAVNSNGSVCFRLSFEAAPRPGTGIDLHIEQRQTGSGGRFWITNLTARIGSHGHVYFTLSNHTRALASRLFRSGWREGRLEILWQAQKGPADGHSLFRFGGHTTTFQAWEPFIRQPLLGLGNDPWAGRLDSFGTSG